MRILLVVFLTVLVGCGGRAAKRDAARTAIEEKANRDAVYETCSGASPAGAECGLLAPEFWSDAGISRFVERVCAGEYDDQCAERIVKSWLARLSMRYKRANVGEVARYCDAYPDKCADNVTFERLWLKSHNMAVDADEERALAGIDRQQAEDEDARMRAVSSAFLDAARAMQGKKTYDCETRDEHTTCRER